MIKIISTDVPSCGVRTKNPTGTQYAKKEKKKERIFIAINDETE